MGSVLEAKTISNLKFQMTEKSRQDARVAAEETGVKGAGETPAVPRAKKNDVATGGKIDDRGVALRWHRQECLCY